MSRNLLVGASVYGGSVVIPLDAGNIHQLSLGSVVALDEQGHLKAASATNPALGILVAVSPAGGCSVGIAGVFNVVGQSNKKLGERLAGLPNSLVISEPFDGWSVDEQGKKSTVNSIVQVKI